ncbi:MAG: SH3 domain-containing C40 family peptidase [Romboutsia timonensis]|uniref:C40 family peptidase n=1 Tax=Romboutsia timonensis TaxID=1776391 RepID=UPI002A7626FE|nr:SH3 domain-containing C40 family peptidase [Romboutsia timonensis]MDY3002350.1 SH3 domain-containing C40 family peptidase [Romboutsia timonensis]
MLKRNIITVLVAVFIVISNIQTIYGLEKGIVRPCDYLNIRIGPGTKYSILAKAHTNNIVDILEKDGSWCKIRTSNYTEGWVSSKYIELYNENLVSTEEVKEEQLNIQNNIISVANSQIGKPYKWGTIGPNSFDCSGFTSYIYKNGAGISLPRTSVSQSKVGTKISRNQLKSGDLVFFNTSGKGISHVGVYIGDSKFIHASTSKGVRIDSLNSSYYKSKFVSASRIIK